MKNCMFSTTNIDYVKEAMDDGQNELCHNVNTKVWRNIEVSIRSQNP